MTFMYYLAVTKISLEEWKKRWDKIQVVCGKTDSPDSPTTKPQKHERGSSLLLGTELFRPPRRMWVLRDLLMVRLCHPSHSCGAKLTLMSSNLLAFVSLS